MLRLIAICAMTFSLSGCFFVMIPGPAIDALRDGIHGTHGRYCVSQSAQVGDTLRLPDGGVGVVSQLEGPSRRCRYSRPIRVEIIRQGE